MEENLYRHYVLQRYVALSAVGGIFAHIVVCYLSNSV